MGKVRGLGVRGLGDKQYTERLMTKYKIVSFLDVSPFTYEQLREVSSIQRNVLRKNLDILVKEGTVLEHKYSIPYTYEFYGYMYKYPVPYMSPSYGRKYYLLDCSKPHCDGFMNFYYNNKAREKGEPFNETFKKERQKRQKKLCAHQDEIKSFKPTPESRFNDMTPSEIRDEFEKMMEYKICLERMMREREIISVKAGKRFRYDEQLNVLDEEEELNDATKVTNFFIGRGYSMLDVLIRCSTEVTCINPTDSIVYDLELGLTRYGLLWKIMKKAGLLRSKN